MKERPILFSGQMVRAILGGRKTQTRRLVKRDVTERDGKHFMCGQLIESNPAVLGQCPYGKQGDRLWVRETWSDHPDGDGIIYRATDPCWDDEETGLEWKPSIHMPRWASRITLEIVSVRVERLQEISAEDCEAEGVFATWCDPQDFDDMTGAARSELAIENFEQLWDSINGKKPGASWESNPWVWVIEFRKIMESEK